MERIFDGICKTIESRQCEVLGLKLSQFYSLDQI
jgi:hypothetical protein